MDAYKETAKKGKWRRHADSLLMTSPVAFAHRRTCNITIKLVVGEKWLHTMHLSFLESGARSRSKDNRSVIFCIAMAPQ
jgi:hypothetical protein